ncbi:MAG: 4Fe-4S binding protein [bacterium]|nr:4Fe-4S binding protein [bacterium]
MKIEITIDESLCKACAYCIEACPKKNLEFSSNINKSGYHPVRVIDKSKCTGCGMCYQVCPEIAITVENES